VSDPRLILGDCLEVMAGMEPEYLEIAEARINNATRQGVLVSEGFRETAWFQEGELAAFSVGVYPVKEEQS
jgi:hypothetical protein